MNLFLPGLLLLQLTTFFTVTTAWSRCGVNLPDAPQLNVTNPGSLGASDTFSPHWPLPWGRVEDNLVQLQYCYVDGATRHVLQGCTEGAVKMWTDKLGPRSVENGHASVGGFASVGGVGQNNVAPWSFGMTMHWGCTAGTARHEVSIPRLSPLRLFVIDNYTVWSRSWYGA